MSEHGPKRILILWELRCMDCKEISLLQMGNEEPNVCPYCEGTLDYAPGPKTPALLYRPGDRYIPLP